MEDCEEVLWWVCLSGVFGLFRQCFGCGVFCIVLDLVSVPPQLLPCHDCKRLRLFWAVRRAI